MKNKKGINQVEYISAMLIFLFGLITIMYFVLTFNLAEQKDYLTAIEQNFKKETEISYSKYFLDTGDFQGSCFSISGGDLPFTINSNKLTILKGEEGQSYQEQDGNLLIEGNSGEYNFIISENKLNTIPLTPTECSLLSNPKFSLRENLTALSFTKIQEMKIDYYQSQSSYEILKQTMAENKNFAITFRNIDCPSDNNPEGFSMSRYIPKNVEVIAGEFPVKIFITPKDICDANVLIKIWKD